MLLERHGHSVSIQCILELGAPDFAVQNPKPTFAMRQLQELSGKRLINLLVLATKRSTLFLLFPEVP